MDKAPTDEQRQRRELRVTQSDTVRYRRVKLLCRTLVLCEADNWYVPGRLTSEMNKSLATTDSPSGVWRKACMFSDTRFQQRSSRLSSGVSLCYAKVSEKRLATRYLDSSRSDAGCERGRPRALAQNTIRTAGASPVMPRWTRLTVSVMACPATKCFQLAPLSSSRVSSPETT